MLDQESSTNNYFPFEFSHKYSLTVIIGAVRYIIKIFKYARVQFISILEILIKSMNSLNLSSGFIETFHCCCFFFYMFITFNLVDIDTWGKNLNIATTLKLHQEHVFSAKHISIH